MDNGSDKRSVTTDALDTLGTIIDEHQKRDAIHLAVEPVIAGGWLSPADEITVINGVATRAAKGKGIGIVDPFLLDYVEKGQRFWFVMKPRQVRSLRHVWTHPAFTDEPQSPEGRRSSSQEYIAELARSLDITPNRLITAATDYLDHSEYLSEGGRFEGMSIPGEFWQHFEEVTGRKVPEDDRDSFLSCSC